jgi:hypothetical protein
VARAPCITAGLSGSSAHSRPSLREGTPPSRSEGRLWRLPRGLDSLHRPDQGGDGRELSESRNIKTCAPGFRRRGP